ncbi:5-carboxymethyl-2-hydroxymuconate Delta-isomerase [Craterilacuibacter sp.]|uniref:5-carboxymethyl-2-hydroxymuconate Delta-isomerase n=1 Tax=Craterilacuibacter sp. TaxID=2870909 RepID=UPI003F410FFF
MPHLNIEYSDNLPALDAGALLLAMNQALLASGQFDECDIKSRAQKMDAFRIGVSLSPRAFVHGRLSILDGRPHAIRQALSACLLQVLQQQCWPAGLELQLSVEVLEIERTAYAKACIEC